MVEHALDPARYYARTYDVSVSDWPGEIDFYLALARRATARGLPVLEIACGTGRVATRLAEDGARVVGLDHSAEMLAVAQEKSVRLPNVRWVEGDMRSFDLGETFGLVLVPGHSFQNIVTPEDQVSCLRSIRTHLAPGGNLVLHLDNPNVDWLGGLLGAKGGVFEPAEEFLHPVSGRRVRAHRAWTYEPSTQTAVSRTVWEEFAADGELLHRVESGPIRLHCVFRFEVEHLLARTGYEVQAVYGDFFGRPLDDRSLEMVWVAGRPEAMQVAGAS